MALVLAWSPEALEDIEAIAAYIGRDSPCYARAVVSRLVDTAELIPAFPQLGPMVPELGDPTIRQRLVHKFRLIYRLEEHRVLIVAVIHGRQDFPAKWHGRDASEI